MYNLRRRLVNCVPRMQRCNKLRSKLRMPL